MDGLCRVQVQARALDLPLFTQLFPDAAVHRLPDAAHYSPEDAPDQVAALVLDFLKKN